MDPPLLDKLCNYTIFNHFKSLVQTFFLALKTVSMLAHSGEHICRYTLIGCYGQIMSAKRYIGWALFFIQHGKAFSLSYPPNFLQDAKNHGVAYINVHTLKVRSLFLKNI